jgi:tetratricopeptide (TPR) repeat protein
MNGRTDRIREACWYADRLFAGRHYRAIMGLVTRAIEEDGEDVGLLLRRARALLAAHRDGDAERDVERAIAIAPGSVDAHVLLAEIALRRRDVLAADRHLGVAFRRAPADRRAAELRDVVSGWYRAARRIAERRRVAPVARAA